MNEITDNIWKKYSLYIIIAIGIGALRLKLFYFHFNIDIFKYIELTYIVNFALECALTFFFSILIIFIYYFIKVSNFDRFKERFLNDIRGKKSYSKYYNLHMLIAYIGFALSMIGLLIFKSDSIYHDLCLILCTASLSIGILLTILGKELSEKNDIKILKTNERILLFSMLWIFLTFNLSLAYLDILKVNNNIKNISYKVDGEVFTSSEEEPFIGETTKYIFLYNNKKNSSRIIHKDSISNLNFFDPSWPLLKNELRNFIDKSQD